MGLPVHVPFGHSPFFLALGFIIVTRKAETLAGMGHCGLCVCRPVQTDRRRKDREAHVIYRFAWSFTVLFWRTRSPCPHRDLTCPAICQPE